MSDFPIILIPSSIQQALVTRPPIFTFTEPAPKAPGAKPQKINYPLVATEVALAIIISAAISSGSAGLGFLSLLAAAGAIAFQVWQQIETYPQRKRDHQCEVNDYPKKFENYNRRQRQHEEESRASQTPERIAEFRYNLLRDALSHTSPHDGDRSIAPKGKAEAKFGDRLKQYFPSKIHFGLVIRIPNFHYPYTPDFTYIDSSVNLYIDIEIDEPYALKTKEPTHYREARKDENRNKFFLGKGWIVIRFSEEQVVCHPQSCCKTIAQAITEVLGNISVLDQFANIPDLQKMQQWTQSEAEEMAASNHRDGYLQKYNELADSPIEIEVEVQKSVMSSPNSSRAQSRGANRAANRAVSSISLSKLNYIDEQVAIIKTGKKAHQSLLKNIFAASHQGDSEKMEEALLVLEAVEKRGLNKVVSPGYSARIRSKALQEFNIKVVKTD